MTSTDANETAIRGLIDTFVAGWNSADGVALARAFAVDADFTNIMGLRARGRDLIARGHAEILSTLYRGTKLMGEVEAIRFLRLDVAVVDVKFTLRRQDGSLAFGIPHTSAGLVATKDGETWSIAVFRNMVPFARPVAGALDQELMSGRTA